MSYLPVISVPDVYKRQKSTSRSSGRWDGTAYRGIVSGLILSGDCKMQAQGTADRDGVRKQFA